MTVAEFIHMDGDGAFIWSAYGLAFLVLGFQLLSTWGMKRKIMKYVGNP